jgi:hypothetical protein
MTYRRKLPMASQLVLVTTAVMFLVAAIRIYFLGDAVWTNWESIQSAPGVLDLSPIYMHAAFGAALAATSAFVFSAVLREAPRSADYSFLFLSGLLGMVLWGAYAWVMRYRGIWDYQDMSRVIWVFAAIRLALLFWIGGLMVAVFPTTMFRRLVPRGHA